MPNQKPFPYLASILITGSEVTEGRIVDTNSQYLSDQLAIVGVRTNHILACDDSQEAIVRSIAFLLESSDILIISGGLGPTTDDLTREAIAEFASVPLEENAAVLKHLMALYEKRQRRFTESNKKQALFPKTAEVVPNPVGTAAGFILTHCSQQNHKKYLISLPGVPWELKLMIEQSILPWVKKTFQIPEYLPQHVLRVFGLPEALIGEKVAACGIDPQQITIAYRAAFPEIQVLLRSLDHNAQAYAAAIDQARKAIGEEFIFSEDLKLNLETTLHQLLLQQNKTVAVAESCTAGKLGMLLTEKAGSSAFFVGGVICYSNQIKNVELSVPENELTQFGAVSKEVAISMASGARKKFQADYALSITGIAGPDGGTARKPVGTFYVGLATPDRTQALQYFFDSERTRVREYAAHMALDLLRRELLGLSLARLANTT